MRAIKDLVRKSVARSTFRKIIAVRKSICDLVASVIENDGNF